MSSLQLTLLQRGLLEKLVKRGKPVHIKIIGAIMDWPVPTELSDLELPVCGINAQKEWEKFLPKTLCQHIFAKPLLQIKLEP